MNVIRDGARLAGGLAVFGIAAALAGCDYGSLYGPARTPDPVAVSVDFCALEAPSWVAFQDGDGAWSRATPEVSGGGVHSFRHTFATDRGAIATLSDLGGGVTFLNVFFGGPQELAGVGDTLTADCIPSGPKTLFGSVAGLGATSSATVSTGFSLRAVVPPGQTTYKMNGLADRQQDLLAARFDPINGNTEVTRLIVRRGLNLPDSATLPVLDFGAAEAFDAVKSQLTITGLAGTAATATFLHSVRSEMILTLSPQSSVTSLPYFALPGDRVGDGELQVLRVNSATADGQTRTATRYFRAPADRTIAFGGAVIAPTVTAVATSPTLRLRATFTAQDEYDRLTSLFLQQGTKPLLLNLAMTPAYATRSGRGTVLEVPDLSGVAGFDPAWTLAPAGEVLWGATRIGGTLGAGRNVIPADGAAQISAFRAGTFNP